MGVRTSDVYAKGLAADKVYSTRLVASSMISGVMGLGWILSRGCWGGWIRCFICCCGRGGRLGEI